MQKTKIGNPDKTVRLLFEDLEELTSLSVAGATTSSDPAFPAIT